MADPISFIAALSGQNTAAKWLSVSSDGSCKLVLEASATELGSVLRLAPLGGVSLRVTIEQEQ